MKRCVSPSLLPENIAGTVENKCKLQRQASEAASIASARQARRVYNLQTWGGNCNQEATVVRQLKDVLHLHGVEVLVLNDYTHADVLIRPLGNDADSWLPLQVKTTCGPRPPRRDCKTTIWRFSNVKGYTGMPVLCCVVSCGRRWLADGAIFTANDADFSSGSKYTQQSIDVHNDAKLAAQLLEMHSAIKFTNVDEWTARWDIKRETHRIEMQSIVLWLEHVCIPSSWTYRWPGGQGLSYDLEVSKDAGSSWERIQFKKAANHATNVRASGYSLPLQHQAGYGDDGKPRHKPYSVGDADLYVCIRWDEAVVDVWTFEEAGLEGYLSSKTSNGKPRISIHLPTTLTSEHVNDGRPGSKGGPINNTVWTRKHHCRYMRVRDREGV